MRELAQFYLQLLCSVASTQNGGAGLFCATTARGKTFAGLHDTK